MIIPAVNRIYILYAAWHGQGVGTFKYRSVKYCTCVCVYATMNV